MFMGRQYISIVFHNYGTIAGPDPIPCPIKAIEIFTFLKNYSFRGIQVFGSRIFFLQYPPAKGNYFPSDIKNRENNPIPETIIIMATFTPGNHPGFLYFFYSEFFFEKKFQQAVPSVGSISKVEFFYISIGKASFI